MFQTTLIIFISLILSGCGFRLTSSNIFGKNSTLSGIIKPLRGSIAHQRSTFISEAYAVICTDPVYAKLYEIENDGTVDEAFPLSTYRLKSDARYIFDTDILRLDQSGSNVRYMIKAEGCNGEVYKRPVTNFNQLQDVDAKSTVVADVVNASGLTVVQLNQASRQEVENLINQISGETPTDAFTSITTHPLPSAKFSSLFGASPNILNDGKPEVSVIYPKTNLDEHTSHAFRIQAFHVNPSYSFLYRWKLDGVVKSSAATWTYIPDGHSQGNHTIDVYVGQNDGSGNIDVTMPYFIKSLNIKVNNNIRPVAPLISLDPATPSPRTTNSVNVRLATGIALSECENFANMALTESPVAPNAGSFTLSCSTLGTQVETVTFSTGDGNKTLYLWARDQDGDVSAARTVSLVLDTTPPVATVSPGAALIRGGTTKVVSLAASDATSGVASAALSFSSNGGTSWTSLTSVSSGTSSYNWSVPAIDTTNARLRLVVTDNAGQTTTTETSDFEIDSTAPLAPAFSFHTPRPTSSSVVQLTIGSCSDSASVYWSALNNIAPNGSEGSWDACSTTAGAYARTLSADGTQHLYLWTKDAAGIISPAPHHDTVVYDTTQPVIATGPTLSSTLQKGGVPQTITWSVTDTTVATISLWYSSDSGTTFNSIATAIANSGSHTWTIPTLDTTIILRLRASDELGFQSEASFSFTADSTAPALSMDQPSTNPYKGGSTVTLNNLSATDTNNLSSMAVSFSSDGTTFGSSVSVAVAASSISVTVPAINTSAAKIKLSATDAVGNSGTFITNAFTVDSIAPTTPSIARTSALYNPSANVTMTPASCADTPYLLVNESSVPSETDAGWVACSTTASSLSYTIPTTTEGLHTLKIWAKDAAGNVAATSQSVQTWLDLTAPSLTINSIPVNVKGGTTHSVSLSLTELHTVSTQNIFYEFYNGSAWSALGTKAITNGPLTSAPFVQSFTLPTATTSAAKVRATFADLAGRSTTVTSADFIVDTAGPSGTSITVNNGGTSTGNKNVLVTFTGTDSLNNIDSFCLKYNQTALPTSGDSCWVTISSIGITPGLSATVTNYPFLLGSIEGDYAVSVWFKDSHGNISDLSADYTIGYRPDPPPVLSNIIASSSDTPSSPLTTSDTTLPLGFDVYIRWKITDNFVLPSSSISLSYTTNETNYTTIASSLSNSAGSGCTLTAETTGCYKWTAASPTSGYYRVKLTVTDSGGTTVFDVSNPINTGSVKFLSGNTSHGIGGAAINAILLGANEAVYNDYHDAQSFVVTKTGLIFYKYFNRGLVYISPVDGIIRDLALTTGTASGDGGSVFSSTFRAPGRIVLDYADNVLIWDYDKVRKIDLSTNPWTITTLFGGGADATDGANALFANIGINYADNLTVTPNGRVYFNKNSVIWYYDPTDSKVKTHISLTGFGTDDMAAWRATYNNVSCPGTNSAIGFNKTTSTITKIIRRMSSSPSSECGSATGNYPYYNTSFNVTTGVANAPHPGQTVWSSFKFTGMDGNIYVLNQGRQTLTKYIPGSNTFQIVLGSTANGRCADGTPATTCKTVIMSAFVTEFGKIYFIDLGVLRTVDNSGNVQTVAGQPRNFGVGFNPVSARFSAINFFDVNGNDVYVRNELENQIVKFSLTGGNLSLVAGNTVRGAPTVGASAVATSLPNCGWSTPCSFIIDSANNRLYHNSNSGGNVSYIDLATGLWVTQATGLQDTSARVSYVGINSDGLLTYLPSHFGVTGNKVTLRVFNQNSNTSTIIYGQNSTLASLSGSMCTGVNGTTCTYPHTMDASVQERFKYDSGTASWLLSIKNSNSLYSIPSLGGNVSLFKSMTNGFIAYDYYHDGTTGHVFYCSTSGNLHKRNLTTNIETALTLPISSMKCTSGSLFYSSTRGSLIFAYTQNGLFGIAEYLSP